MKHDHSDSHDHQTSQGKVLDPDINGSTRTVLFVTGVDCSEEVAAIESALQKTGYVREVIVSILSGKATILHEGKLSDDEIIAVIKLSLIHI